MVRKYNISLENTSNLGDNSSKDATPMVMIQTDNVALIQEELAQLEKDNPLEAIDFLVKGMSFSPKATESRQTFLVVGFLNC